MSLNVGTAISEMSTKPNFKIFSQPEAWQRTELSPAQDGGLRASWRILRVRVPSGASGALRIRCESILLVEPPVVRDAVSIITIPSRTQLSKFVSNKSK